MSDTDPAETKGGYQLQRRIDQVDAKIDKVDAKVVAGANETKVGFDNLNRLLDERWKSMEQRYDMTDRQKQQSIDLLTQTVMRLEQGISATDTNVAMAAQEALLTKARLEDQKHQADAVHAELRKDITHITDMLRWTSRAFWGAVITSGVGGMVYVFSQAPPS